MWLTGDGFAGIDEPYVRSDSNKGVLATFFGQKGFGRSYALIIGIGDYSIYQKLSAPAEDAERVRNFLRDEAKFDEIVTLTDEKATRSRIESLMERTFPQRVQSSDRFLFYFSGHGITRTLRASKRGYLVLKSSQKNAWDEMIDMPRIREWIENLGNARHVLFVIDSCFSGLSALEFKGDPDIKDRTIERLMQPASHILTAGVEGEESYIVNQESLFTKGFLAAARGTISAPKDGIISLSEILVQVNRFLDGERARLGDKLKMTPHSYYSRTDNNAGEFFFLPAITPVTQPQPTAPVMSPAAEAKGVAAGPSKGPQLSAGNQQPQRFGMPGTQPNAAIPASTQSPPDQRPQQSLPAGQQAMALAVVLAPGPLVLQQSTGALAPSVANVPIDPRATPQRLDQLRNERQQTQVGNQTVIREADRVIIREGGHDFIRHNEADRFRFNAREVNVEHRGNDTITVALRPDGSQIVTEVDPTGRLLRRVRRDAAGREVVLIDNTFEPHGSGFGGYFIDLPPPVIRIPREVYMREVARATAADIFLTLMAPPVDRIERRYALDEIRYSESLRVRMPRVDIDTVNFESGSWEMTPDQADRLAFVAQGLVRAIQRNPREMFLVEGYWDATGNDIDNLSLSDRRAESVAVMLTNQFGVPAENLITQGYGKQFLKVPTDGPERANRRVAIRRITPLLAGQS